MDDALLAVRRRWRRVLLATIYAVVVLVVLTRLAGWHGYGAAL